MDEQKISHPDWCQRDRCVTNTDGSVTHGHLLGTVSDIDVMVARTDAPDDKGKVKPGPSRAFSHINRTGPLSGAELDRVYRLYQQAAVFTGQRQNRGGGY